ncbi:galanin receptor type 1-like [Stylophora pistillata]|uniref:galanin receptor type 1-like n=1 Tax=Stylophora pistillata TaxID=50429 RepID=UPI000C0427B3|nr:galanin receptor type 1-like [Stylophora pistillata]
MNNTTGVVVNSPSESETLRAMKMTLYATIFIIGISGNTLVCLVVCRQQKLRTSTNFYIMNLAVADLAVTIVCIPFDVAVQENGYVWPFGKFLCHIIYPIMTMCTFASVGTLTAIAYNRYTAISRPMRMQGGRKWAKVTIAAIWTLSLVFVLPYIIVLTTKNSHCVENWSTLHSRLYTWFIFIFQYVIPLSIISLAYVKIAQQLRINRNHLTPVHRVQERDVSKVVRMLVVVVLIFAVCMLPNHILWLLSDFHKDFPEAGRKVYVWGEILIYANSCTNPIVYSICIEEFRVAFKAYITKCCRVTDEDLRPVRNILERISMREKSQVSQADRMLARQLSRRLRGSFQRTQSFESRASLPRIFRSRTSRSNILGGELPQLLDRMLPPLSPCSPNTDTGRNTPNPEAIGNVLAVTAV